MIKSKQFPAIIITEDLGYGRRRKRVVDTETGEIMLQKDEGNPLEVFRLGANVCPLTDGTIGRGERRDDGTACFYVTDYSNGEPQVLGVFWEKPKKKAIGKPKHTGGKLEYLKLFVSKLRDIINGLSDKDLGALFRFTALCNWETNVLVDSRKKQPLDYAGLKRVTGYSETTLARRIAALKSAGILNVNGEGHYFLNPRLVQKGHTNAAVNRM